MVFPGNIEGVDPATQSMIESFSSRYHHAMEALEERRYAAAREHYLELLRLYQDLRDKRIDPIHMNIAYSCIEDLYNDLQHRVEVPVISGRGLKVGVCVSILLILVSMFIIAKPSVVGLTVMDQVESTIWMGPNQFTIEDITTFNLNDLVDGPYDITYLVSEGRYVKLHLDGSILTMVPPRKFKGMDKITILGYRLGNEQKFLFKRELHILVI